MLNKSFNPPNVPLFYVEGLNNLTNHLRLFTASKYVNGKWIPDKMICTPTSSAPKVYKVTPIVNLTGYLPVAKDTKSVFPHIFTCYDSYTGTYKVKSTRQQYFGSTAARIIYPTIFKGSAKYNDPELKALALKITKNAKSDYAKVLAIENYLKKHYTNSYVVPPKGVDPVHYFLFVSKHGTCREFASAFVLLSQSIGIPARVVFGYLARPTPANQTIFASNAHVWAEVRFKEGWVEFDPTPPPVLTGTVTKVTYVDKKIIAGHKFRIEGTVKSTTGFPVSGYVEIYFKKNKQEEGGILAGIVRVVDGKFSAELKAPNITGRYDVVAHYTGSKYFAPSWSDPIVIVYSKPYFDVKIPDKISTIFWLNGSLRTVKPYTGYIFFCIDSSCKKVRVEKGNFSIYGKVSPGYHQLRLVFFGGRYYLKTQITKKVLAGNVKVKVISAEYGKPLRGEILFNGEPINTTVIVDGIRTLCVKEFEIKLPLKLGKNIIDVYMPNLLYKGKITVYVKERVTIDSNINDGKLYVYVHNGKTPADGFVKFLGVRKKLENGKAVFTLPKNFRSGIIYYSGSDKFFPAKKKIESEFFWYPLLLIPVAAAAVYIYMRREGKIEIIFEKEHPKLPNVWDIGEVVRFRLSEEAEVKVNGKVLRGKEFSVKFNTYGVKKIVAERVEGRKIKRGFAEIKIKNYNDAIADLMKDLEKRLEFDAKSKTAREIARILGLKNSKLVWYFELARYGRGNFTRKEFLEAFEDYLKVVER